jgi:tRNA G18 (ribose-2'-O)-methylase SpoU
MKPLIGTELKRFNKEYRRQNPAKRQISTLLQSVEYPYNVGAIFRLAEGARLHELILTGITPSPPNPTIEKIGRYKEGKVRWRYEKDPLVALRDLRESGIQIVAIELADEAVPYHEFDYPDKCCLVVGHEDHGVTKATLAQCDAAVFIPMFGKGRSHNVHTALAIVAYHALLTLPNNS